LKGEYGGDGDGDDVGGAAGGTAATLPGPCIAPSITIAANATPAKSVEGKHWVRMLRIIANRQQCLRELDREESIDIVSEGGQGGFDIIE
jgi:hypothetical protein